MLKHANLTLSLRRSVSYRNQSIGFHCRSMVSLWGTSVTKEVNMNKKLRNRNHLIHWQYLYYGWTRNQKLMFNYWPIVNWNETLLRIKQAKWASGVEFGCINLQTENINMILHIVCTKLRKLFGINLLFAESILWV